MNRNTRTLGIVIYLGLGLGGGLGLGLMTNPTEGKPAKSIGASIGSKNASIEATLDALIQVESSGNNRAVGDQGRALGCLQIHKAYWIEGTQLLGVSWPYSDAVDRAKARAVARAYLTRYNPTGMPETWARTHNGGSGWKKHPRATDKYWLKVKAEMAKKGN